MDLNVKMKKKSGSHFLKEDDKALIKSVSLSTKIHSQQKFLVSLLPMYAPPKKLLLGDGLPCHGVKKIKQKFEKKDKK